jgi:putative ABC transport system permease protein
MEGSSQTLVLEGYPPQRDPVAVQVRQITPGYLRAMGIPVLHGRDLFESDAEVLLVSRDAAKLYWGADDPIGRRAILPAVSNTVLRQVVGIVGDVKQRNLIEATTPTVYFYSRAPYGRATFVIRASVPPATLAQPAIAAIRAIDSGQPIGEIRTMSHLLDRGLTSQRFSALLLGIFAAVALLLSAIGIYSVLSYIVRGRRCSADGQSGAGVPRPTARPGESLARGLSQLKLRSVWLAFKSRGYTPSASHSPASFGAESQCSAPFWNLHGGVGSNFAAQKSH